MTYRDTNSDGGVYPSAVFPAAVAAASATSVETSPALTAAEETLYNSAASETLSTSPLYEGSINNQTAGDTSTSPFVARFGRDPEAAAPTPKQEAAATIPLETDTATETATETAEETAADTAADLSAYRQLHRERYNERLLKETEEAEALRRQEQEKKHLQLARRLQQEEMERLAMDIAARQERDRQLLEARLSPPSSAAPSAAGVAAPASDTEGGYYAQAPSEIDATGEEHVRPPLRTNYAERLLDDDPPPPWGVSPSRSQRLLGGETARGESGARRALRMFADLTRGRLLPHGNREERSLFGLSFEQLFSCCLWVIVMALPLAVLVYELSSLTS